MQPTEPSKPATIRELGLSWIRTGVPYLWGYVLTFLAARAPAIHDLVDTPYVFAALSGAVALAWYWLMRKAEHKIPPWLTRLVLGANTAPSYWLGADAVAARRAARDLDG